MRMHCTIVIDIDSNCDVKMLFKMPL